MRSLMEKSLNLDYVKLRTKWWTAVFISNKIHKFSLNDQWSKLLWRMFYNFLILRLRLRSTAEGRSFSGPNIRLRPKVKIVPTVQHCKSLLSTPSNVAFTPQANFPAHILNFHWRWRWWDQIQAPFKIFSTLEYRLTICMCEKLSLVFGFKQN